MSIQKNFSYRLEIDGLEVALVQTATLPLAEFTESLHGVAGDAPDIKTPNKISFGDLTLSKLVRAEAPDNWAWTRLASALGGVQAAYEFDAFLSEIHAGRVVRRYVIQGGWVKSVQVAEKQSSNENAANSLEEVVISVRAFFPEPITVFKNLG